MHLVSYSMKKMKRHKAPGLSGLVTEMIQATGDTGTQWILDSLQMEKGDKGSTMIQMGVSG